MAKMVPESMTFNPKRMIYGGFKVLSTLSSLRRRSRRERHVGK